MPHYAYKGRNHSGSLVTGTLQAASLNDAVSELSGKHITPIEIDERQAPARKPRPSTAKLARPRLTTPVFGGGKVDIAELIVFSRQMYSLTKAGMPLDRALRGLEASLSSWGMKRVLRDIIRQLEKGLDLTAAMSRHPKVFSQLYLSLIHVGENTGRLDLAFQQVGKYLELERNTRKQFKSATRYPLFVIVAIAVALAIITTFVIPVFADTFAQLQAQLPWQTRVLIAVSDFVVTWWPLILGGIGGAIALFLRWIATSHGRLAWDRRKLGFVLVGGLFERIALSRFSRTFAMMLRAGVPLVQALGVVARAVGNKFIGHNVLKMRDGVSHGESLYVTASKTGMFSPLVLQMIAVGEEGGNVDDMLDEVADFYDAEVEYDLKRLSASIEPILIIFIAGLVLVLALGVFLPIWDLARAAR
ncbi:MAG TPA: type II secretion system F family protein [Hyphomicrobiales bacterium]|nr:type II secretion system F family protein [Hyphomicrobiales bacterium]